MPKPKKGPRLGGSPSHQRKMLANLAASLIQEERITTTETRAKQLRPYVEKMVTKARRGDLHARRLVLRKIQDSEVVTKLFDDVGPRYADRPGGYTRIVKLGPRRGDGAERVLPFRDQHPRAGGSGGLAGVGHHQRDEHAPAGFEPVEDRPPEHGLWIRAIVHAPTYLRSVASMWPAGSSTGRKISFRFSNPSGSRLKGRKCLLGMVR